MNLKTTYVLFGLLLAALLTFVAYQFWGSDKSNKDNEGLLFPEFSQKKDSVSTADIESVRIEHHGDDKTPSILLVRNQGSWQIREPSTLRADSYQVDNLLRQVTSAKREKSEMSSNLAQYGLDNPSEVITLKKGDAEWRLNVGKQAPGTGGVLYVSTGADPKEPAAVRKSSLDSVFKKLNDYRSRDLLDAKGATATEVRLDAKGATLALKKTDKGTWRFEKPDYGTANFEGSSPTPAAPVPVAKKLNGVRELIDEAGGLRVETQDDFIRDGVSEADLANEYGLANDAPETLKIEVKTKPPEGDEKTQVLLIGKKTEKIEKSEEKKEDKNDSKKDEKKPEQKTEYYFARLADENAVVRIPAAKVKPLLDVIGNPEPLRNRDLVTLNFPAKIDAINIQTGSEVVKLRQSDNQWKLYQDGGHLADQRTVTDLTNALTGSGGFGEKTSPVKTFVDKDEGVDWGKKDNRVVSLWIDGIKKDEKKEEKKEGDKPVEKKDDKEPELTSDKPTVKLTFATHKDLLYVQREEADGTKSVFTVNDNLLDKIPADRLAYLDRKLPTFSNIPRDAPNDISKVALYQETVVNDKVTPRWAVTKEKDGDKSVWKFAQPHAGRTADTFAVDNLIRNLASLSAIKIVNEKAGDLAGYGLAVPKLAIVVTVKKDDKTEDWIYSFGGEKEYASKKPGEKPGTTVEEKKPGVFAKINKSDMVFLVGKDTVDQLRNTELRDLAVFNFDPKKVKGAEITVFSNDLGAPVTLKLERKGDDDWAKKESPIEPDGKKVESFIRTLSQLKASKYVTAKPSDDKTGLDPAKNNKALKVKVDVEGGPVELVVGNEDPDNKGFYFATGHVGAARPAGTEEVFLVPEGTFKEAKGGPAYFRKQQ